MNKRTTGLLMGICISALAASFSTAVAFANADVAEQEQTAPVLKMQEGASIRYMKPVGIRFVTDVATDKYNDIIDADSEAVFGTLIIPKEVLGNTVITADNYLTIGAENIVAKTWLPDTKTTKSYACALGGTKNEDGTYNDFPEKYYNADLYAVSYCSYKATVEATKNTVIFAENPQTYSVAYIASALQAKGDTDEILSKITDSVLGKTMAFASETYVMCKGDTLQTVLNAKGLKATYSTDNAAIATVNENGVVTGVGAGTAQITAKIGNKTATVKLTVTEHNWQKTTTVLRHSLECLDCGKSYEGLHEFDSLSDFVCNDSDCAYERDHDRQVATWFEGEDSIAKLNWDGGGYTRSFVTLPQEIGKPADALDAGDKALKLTPDAGHYEIFPVIHLKGVTDCLKDYNNADYVLIWTYLTGPQWADSIMLLGNTREDGIFYDGDLGQKYSDHTSIPKLGATGEWRAIKLTVAELKAALQKQGLISAEWAFIYFNVEQQTDVYLYSVELHRESAQAITVKGDAANYVTVAQSAYPREEVAVTTSGLAYGQSVVIMNAETSEIVKVISENGETSFIMPYGNVSVSIVNVFENTELEEIATNIYRTDNIAIPTTFDGWYDSFTLTVKKGDAVVAASVYEYDEENHTILFVEGGTYELTYTLKKEGAEDVVLTRTVTVSGAIASFTTGTDVAAEMSWGTEQYSSELAELPDEVNKPSQSVDVGNKAWKFTVENDKYYIAPTIYMGDLLKNLNKLNNGDIIRIWIYRTGPQWADTNCYWLGNLNENGKFQTDIAGQQYEDKKDIPVSGTADAWYALDISVADLKTQMIKQGLTSATHLQLFLNFDQNSTAYIYSVEIVKASAQTVTIDSTAQEHVSGLSETQLPLETVTITVSGLGDGEAICVVNNSSNEKVLTVTENGEASFVMPYAGVTVKIITVVESFETMDSVKTITWSQESGTTRELVSAATEGIGTPDGAVKKGGNILKCTISGDKNWSAITVIKIGDLLQEPETLKDNDTVKIWVYFTDEHWDGTDVTNYYVGGLNKDEKFDPIWDNRTGMTTASCTKGTWGAITFTGADLKAAAEKKSGDGTGWMYLQFNINKNSVVYIYSVELYPA